MIRLNTIFAGLIASFAFASTFLLEPAFAEDTPML